jgi:hypothetical protein
MSKWIHDDVLDLLLNGIADNGNELYICSTGPVTYAEATSTYKLGKASPDLTLGDGNGDYTLAAGDVSGRKLTVAQQDSVPITADGDAQHVALVDSVNSKLLAVTTITLLAVTIGDAVTVQAWDLEVGDPT